MENREEILEYKKEWYRKNSQKYKDAWKIRQEKEKDNIWSLKYIKYGTFQHFGDGTWIKIG